MKDAYAVIGVPRKATDEEILAAYKKRARELHPDHGGSPEQMAELNEAYARIKTPELRRKYDASHSFSSTMATWSAAMGKSDVARNFGNAPEWSDPRKTDGTDVPVNVEIPMETFVKGTPLMTVSYTVEHECLECSGTGGDHLETCPECHGERKVRTVTNEGDRVLTCRRCTGTGMVPVGKCAVCGGTGHTSKQVSHSFHYRKGTMDMTVKGKGNGGVHGGANGDLLMEFHPKATDHLSFDGDRFRYVHRIPVEGFILGQAVEIEYPGPLMVKTVPAGKEYGYRETVDDFMGLGYPCDFVFLPDKMAAASSHPLGCG
jgi:molecular chaperone DnaJ